MENQKELTELTKVLTDFSTEYSNKHLILLGSSVFISFKKRDLWNLLTPTHAFKKRSTFNSYFSELVKKGFVSVIDTRRNSDGSKTYTLSNEGLLRLPINYYTAIQLIVDSSSEELNQPDDQSSCEGPAMTVLENTLKPNISDSEKIILMCDHLEKTLLSKNESYGNSSLKPIGIFPLPRTAKVQSRMEDKISRLTQVVRGSDKEALRDTLLDLAGYSILYLIILEEE